MKIALIYPNECSEEKQMPLGIGYLASYVLSRNEGIEIEVLDTGIATGQQKKAFCSNKYDLAGISVSSMAYREAVEIAKILKERNKNTIVVFGGPHVSIMGQKIMKEPVIDFAVYGEGEQTLDEFIKILRKTHCQPHNESLAQIKGLIYGHDSHTVLNPARELIQNVDALPFPAFHLFPMERYPGKYPMITSRGCPHSCVFCASSQIWRRKWRARSPENVIAEVEYIVERYKRRPIDFHDDGFNMSIERLNAICDLFIGKKLRIPWGVRGFRADVIDGETAKKMHRAGCTHVAIGIESANNEMLARMGKRVSIEKINKCITLLRSAGIDVLGQFMIGNPGETLETVRESIKFVKESKLCKTMWGTAVPFPNTGLWNYVQEHGRLLVEPDCTRFDEMTPRIIFETPEFTKQDRLEALRLVEEAGMLSAASQTKSLKHRLGRTASRIWLKYLYGCLPLSISYKLHFFLRRLRSRLSRVLEDS